MLTAKQMKFVEEIGNGGSQSNAYRKAYDTSQMAPKMIWEEASRLRRYPKVAARIVLSWRRKKRLGGACRRSLERIEFSKN